MLEVRDELDDNLAIMLHELEHCAPDERSKLADDIAKLYRVRLDEKKMDDEFYGLAEKERSERIDKIIDKCVDVGIAMLKCSITLAGYYFIARMHANSIEADSYGVLQRSASFRLVPNLNPDKNL